MKYLFFLSLLFGFSSFAQVTTTFTGTASDTDGTIKSVRWRLVSGPTGVTPIISAPASLITNVTFDKVGTYIFGLTATDNEDAVSAEDQITVIVTQNQRPKANAGPDQNLKLPGLLGAYFKNKPNEENNSLVIAFLVRPASDDNN